MIHFVQSRNCSIYTNLQIVLRLGLNAENAIEDCDHQYATDRWVLKGRNIVNIVKPGSY
jgi:hypothetical protein